MIYLNKQVVKFGKFPNKENYLPISKLKVHAYNRVVWLYESDEEFFHLALLKDYLDNTFRNCELAIHYMPHSRMDRVNGSYAMSLKTATKLVNNMGFTAVTVTEPHSDVTPALLNKSSQYDWCMAKVNKIVEEIGIDSLFFPDAGAAKRYSTALPCAVGHKMRDFLSGDITSFDLIGDVGKKVLIVDDLTSKGGTFVHSATLLKKHGAEQVNLLVAHCEKTVYAGELFEHINKLYTSKLNPGIKASDQIILI